MDTAKMPLESLRKLWLALSLVAFIFAVAAHTRLQGGPFSLVLKPVVGIVLDAETPKAILAMWGIYFLSVFYFLSNYVLRIHARLINGDWKQRFPFRVFDIAVDSDIGMKAQVISFFLFTLAPAISIVHFWKTLIKEGVLCSRPNVGDPHVLDTTSSPFGIPSDWSLLRGLGDNYRLASFDGKVCAEATTWFPMMSPLILAVITLAATYMLAAALMALFRGVRADRLSTEPYP